MKIVGLTGGIACGKSTVTHILATGSVNNNNIINTQRDLPIIDMDLIARHVVKKGTKVFHKIVHSFGPTVVDQVSGELDRKHLANIIFSNSLQRKKLNSIVHPAILKHILWQLLVYFLKGEDIVILDSPLLFESGLNKIVNCAIVIYATPEKQKERLQKRDQIEIQEAELKIKSQMDLNKKCEMADFIIDNSYDLTNTQKQVEKVYLQLKKRHTWLTRINVILILLVVALIFVFIIQKIVYN